MKNLLEGTVIRVYGKDRFIINSVSFRGEKLDERDQIEIDTDGIEIDCEVGDIIEFVFSPS